MKAAVMYKSLTGNTKLLAEAIKEALAEREAEWEVVYFGKPDAKVEADLFFVGSWTDKGMCDGEIAELLKVMEQKKIAYFGTAGYGGSEEYYHRLFQRVKEIAPPSNEVIGCFYCQGRMPIAVRNKFVAMMREHPEDKKLEVSIQNFDEALTHPDEDDLARVREWVASMLDSIE